MLRYNSGGIAAKPVDYYRPLTVDVSVEYELPKEVAPPKGSAPLLIIHPSAYFRAGKPTSQSQLKPASTQGHSSAATPTSRLGDIASTLYYLSTNGLPQHPNHSSPMQHINTKPHHGRYGPQTDHLTSSTHSRITRSRTAAKAERIQLQGANCDDYRNGRLGSAVTHAPPHQNYGDSGRQHGGVIKKAGNPAQVLTNHQSQYHHQQMTSIDPAGHNGYNGSTPMDSSNVFNARGQQHPASANSKLQSAPRSSASNKRLRMMSHQVTNPAQLYNNVQLQHGPGGMEPLNLALTPTAQPPAYHNQFSSFLGYGQPTIPVPVGPYPDRRKPNHVESSPVAMVTAQNPYHRHMSGGVLHSNQFISAQVMARGMVMSGEGMVGKEGGPAVPVDKGSGSDSGVCSENDSDDVSPPMAAAPFSSTSTSHSSSRRSNLSTEFPNSGCYCCCCPSTSTSSRKSSRGKGHLQHQQQPQNAFSSNGGPGNYGNFFNVIHQHHQLLGDGSGGVVEPLGGSPMDSSGPPVVQYHQHLQHPQQQRKWMGAGTTGLMPDLRVVNGPGSPFGKWYQV